MHLPVIGVTSKNSSETSPLDDPYGRAIAEAGGFPEILPVMPQENVLRARYEGLNGLLLSGGGDVHPAHYGAKDCGKLKYVHPERDQMELLLARWALAEGKPILGICRGVQLLNVAAGGTLIQDIPSEVPGALPHAIAEPPNCIAHMIALLPGSLLAQVLLADGEPGPLGVNSRHHQAVKQVAPGFVVSARASDGIIEGIERANNRGTFVVGVQWHPENLVAEYPAMMRLFQRFVAACAS